MKSFLVTGGSGLLGEKILALLAEDSDYKTAFTCNKNEILLEGCNSFHLDITDLEEVDKIIGRVSPDVTIHTAALTNVDYCEKNPEEASRVNSLGTGNVAEACEKAGSKLVYVSTDYVFDGKKGMYKEEDATNPINHYGQTKLEGEKAVQQLPGHLIVRPSILYGWHRNPNFVTWVIKELEQNNRIRIVNDQFNTPTLADNLAELILELTRTDKQGIFHASGSERINRLNFAKRIAEAFYLDENLIDEIGSRDMGWVAKRPMDSSLDVSKISRTIRPMGILESLETMREKR